MTSIPVLLDNQTTHAQSAKKVATMATRLTTMLDEIMERAPLGLRVEEAAAGAAEEAADPEAVLDIVELILPLANKSLGIVMLLLPTTNLPFCITCGFWAITICAYLYIKLVFTTEQCFLRTLT